jgi:hypothetical protein
LGAIAGSAAVAPSASAQCFYSCGYGASNYWGYPSYYNYGYNSYAYPYSNYGYNYGYNSCNLGGYYGGFGNCGYNNYNSYSYPYYNYGYSGGYNNYVYPFSNYGYSNYSTPVYYQNAATVTTVAPTYVTTRQLATSGTYCSDKSGGMIWVPAGSPPDPTLNCSGTTASTTTTTTTTGSSGATTTVTPATGGTSGTAYP